MAEYLILIYSDEAAWAAAGPGTAQALLAQHERFVATHGGAVRGGNRLRPTDTATSIRPEAGGGFGITDAPFAETKEVLGGYYLIEAADLDEALAIAKEVPVPFGGVEVRPIWSTAGPG